MECVRQGKYASGTLVLIVLLTVTLLYGELAAQPSLQDALVEGALRQVGKTVGYDGRYQRLRYPGGDVPIGSGVCTDVLIRAYRHIDVDLHVLVHEDMKAAFRQYPQAWGLRRPNANIDHRHVPNLVTFFRRHGTTLGVSRDPVQYRHGDIVAWRLPNGLPHIGMIVRRNADSSPTVVHNIGRGTQVEDILFTYEITGHYRYLPAFATVSPH